MTKMTPHPRLCPLGMTLLLACGPAVGLPEAGSTADAPASSDTGATSSPGSTSLASDTSPVPPTPPGTSTDPWTPTTDGPGSTGRDATGGCTFLGCPLDLPPAIECDLFEQDCPDGEKCAPWANDGSSAWNATRCVPLERSPGLPGDPCTVEGSGVSGVDSCDLGVLCWNVDPETLQGSCVAHCIGSPRAPTCADPTATCHIGGDGVLTLCHPPCDPVTQADCGDDQGCYPVHDSFYCAADASGDGGAAFGECEFTNACEPGTACVDPEASEACPPDAAGCCLPWCDLDAPVCPGEMVCRAWFPEGSAPEGSEFVGLCVDESAAP